MECGRQAYQGHLALQKYDSILSPFLERRHMLLVFSPTNYQMKTKTRALDVVPESSCEIKNSRRGFWEQQILSELSARLSNGEELCLTHYNHARQRDPFNVSIEERTLRLPMKGSLQIMDIRRPSLLVILRAASGPICFGRTTELEIRRLHDS